MFKKAVITDEISQDFRTAVDLALKYHLDGVEIRSVWDKGPHELDERDVAEIKTILAGTGLVVSAISSPFFKCDMDDPAKVEEHITILEKCIKLAHDLDTRIIRGFTFWAKEDFEESLEQILSSFEKPEKLLKDSGMTLVLESDPSVSATNAKKLAKIVSKLDSPFIKALWDPGNDIYDPDKEVPFPDGYEAIKKHMLHMHLKDAKRLDDGKIVGTAIGDGDVDYEGQFKALRDSGYTGFVVLETHYRLAKSIDEKLLAQPKGSEFSNMGYDATEECLIKWDSLLNRLD